MPDPPEPTYTLDEAKRELARRECALQGHDFDVVVDLNEPARFYCSRCGTSWAVQQPTTTTDDELLEAARAALEPFAESVAQIPEGERMRDCTWELLSSPVEIAEAARVHGLLGERLRGVGE